MVPRQAQRTPRSSSYADALATAEALCNDRGTPLRDRQRQVLELLLQAAKPIGAYELLSRLEVVLGRSVKPPTVYRALEFLVAQRLVARIESRNAFAPCTHPDHLHTCVIFICRTCSGLTEIEDPAIERLITRDAATFNFQVERRVVEVEGTCAQCLQGVPPQP